MSVLPRKCATQACGLRLFPTRILDPVHSGNTAKQNDSALRSVERGEQQSIKPSCRCAQN
eukprot:11468-Prorocentrum_minimum.AAC.1